MRLSFVCCAATVWVASFVAATEPASPDHSRPLLTRDPDGTERAIRTPAEWAQKKRQIVAAMQKVMGPLPGREKIVPPDPRIEAVTETDRYVRRKLTIAVEPDDRLPLYLFLPKGRAGIAAAVVCLHPTNRQIGKGVVSGFGNDPGRSYAVELAERGYVTLAPDYVNMGEYRFDAYARGYASATMKGVWNHMRCIDYLQSLTNVDGDHIAAVGHSLGGHNSMFLATFDERVRCVVSSCGFCSFSMYKGGDLTGWSHEGYMPRIRTVYGRNPANMPFDFPEVVAAIAPRPFLVCAPIHDTNFEVQSVRECLDAAAPVYSLFGATDRLRGVYPDAGHEFPEAARKTAYEFLDRWLKPR